MFELSNAPDDQKYAAFAMTTALGGVIMRHPTVKTEMEQFCARFVLPGLSSSNAFIRESVSTLLCTCCFINCDSNLHLCRLRRSSVLSSDLAWSGLTLL